MDGGYKFDNGNDDTPNQPLGWYLVVVAAFGFILATLFL